MHRLWGLELKIKVNETMKIQQGNLPMPCADMTALCRVVSYFHELMSREVPSSRVKCLCLCSLILSDFFFCPVPVAMIQVLGHQSGRVRAGL